MKALARRRPPLRMFGIALALFGCAHAPDQTLFQGGVVDGPSLSATLRCPRGATATVGQTQGVPTAVWCERPGGIKHGPFVEWYANHQKKTAGEFVDGRRQGPWVFFLESGQLDSRITYDKGEPVSAPAPATAPAPAPAASPASAPATAPAAAAPAGPSPTAP